MVVVCGLSCSVVCGILVPRPEIETMSPVLASRFLSTGPPGKSLGSEFKALWPQLMLYALVLCLEREDSVRNHLLGSLWTWNENHVPSARHTLDAQPLLSIIISCAFALWLLDLPVFMIFTHTNLAVELKASSSCITYFSGWWCRWNSMTPRIQLSGNCYHYFPSNRCVFHDPWRTCFTKAGAGKWQPGGQIQPTNCICK